MSPTLESGGAWMYHLQSTASVAPAFPSRVIWWDSTIPSGPSMSYWQAGGPTKHTSQLNYTGKWKRLFEDEQIKEREKECTYRVEVGVLPSLQSRGLWREKRGGCLNLSYMITESESTPELRCIEKLPMTTTRNRHILRYLLLPNTHPWLSSSLGFIVITKSHKYIRVRYP